MNYNDLPNYMKDNGLFCLWKYEQRGDGKPTKVPYQVSGIKAQPNNASTFTTFDTALNVVDKFDGLGIGIFNGISAIDIDHCVTENGELSKMALDIVGLFNGSYMEYSPSGTGLRIIFLISDFHYDKSKYYVNNQSIGLEIYVSGATNKYVTVTGNVLNVGDIVDATAQLEALLDRYMMRPLTPNVGAVTSSQSYLSDDEMLEKATNSKGAEKFKFLWNGKIPQGKSHSDADMALATLLAFWCGRDLEQMDRLFRKSGLMRDKWYRKQSGTTYGRLTLEKAAASVSNTYSPINAIPAYEDFDEVITKDLNELKPFSNNKYPCTDIGNSNLFADYFKGVARYVPQRKQWFVYDGKAWQSDLNNLKVMSNCKKLANKLMHYALSIKDEDTRKLYIDYAKKWQTRRTREIILRDAQDVHPIAMNEFDTNIYLLNCKNGTLNLKTGNFYNHKPTDYITKVSGVNYNPTAKCKRWEIFIAEVMSGDVEKAEFL